MNKNTYENILEINGLTKTYPNFKLDNINFSIPKGSIVGFIGENGAGKTTTIKLILNQLHRDAGSIKVFGLDNIYNEKEVKSRIGAVLDKGFFYEGITPFQISKIMLGISQHWNPAMFFDYLEKFNLPKNQKIKELSKGMSMKLSLATAMSSSPHLLILDEATSGIDPIMRNEILDLFLDFIQDEEKAILISSHITSDLEKIADYIAFIRQGQLALFESKDILLENYGLAKCSSEALSNIPHEDYLGSKENKFGATALVKCRRTFSAKYPTITVDSASLEDIMMFYTSPLLKKER